MELTNEVIELGYKHAWIYLKRLGRRDVSYQDLAHDAFLKLARIQEPPAEYVEHKIRWVVRGIRKPSYEYLSYPSLIQSFPHLGTVRHIIHKSPLQNHAESAVTERGHSVCLPTALRIGAMITSSTSSMVATKAAFCFGGIHQYLFR